MGRSANRASVSEAVGELSNFEISDEIWNILKFKKQVTLPDQVILRKRLNEVCCSHLQFFDLESRASRIEEIQEEIARLRQAICGFQLFATAQVVDGALLSTELRYHLREAVSSNPLQVTVGRTRSRRKRRTFLTIANLREISHALTRIGSSLEASIADEVGYGFRTGDALGGWLLSMRSESQAGGAKIGARLDDKSPSSFAHFLYEVLKAMPTPQRVSVASPSAMAKRLDRLSRPTKRAKSI